MGVFIFLHLNYQVFEILVLLGNYEALSVLNTGLPLSHEYVIHSIFNFFNIPLIASSIVSGNTAINLQVCPKLVEW
jgi:hypothetical protein